MKQFLLLVLLLITTAVTAQVTAGPVPDYIVCDDFSNDGFEIFDLTVLNSTALGNQDPAAHTVTYFSSQFDAVNNLNPLIPSNYTNLTNPQLIFIRVSENATGNFDITTSNLIVEAVPLVNSLQTYTYCGSITATGEIQVDLFEVEPILSNGQSNLLFTYFLSQQDAVTNSNPLSTTFIYQANTPVDLFIRVQTTTNCFEVINMVATLTSCNQNPQLINLESCTDQVNNNACFDLNINTLPALGNNSPNTHAVSYHLSQSHADNNTNSIPTTYCTATSQQIFVRVEEIATGNADTTQSFFINVNSIPDTYSFTPITGCDDDGDGFIEWDSSSVLNEVTNVPNNVINFSTEYYLSQLDAENQVNPIGFVGNFVTSSITPTVYVRTTFFPTNCSSVSPLQLVEDVNCIIIGNPNPLEECLQTPNTVACFDLTVNDALILDTNNPTDFTVTYYATNADAMAGTNAIANASSYCLPSSAVAFARLEENATGAFQVRAFDLIVRNSLFDFVTLSDLTECDDNLDGTVVFDLTDFENQLSTVNTLSYHLTLADAQNNANAIATPANFDVATTTGGQRIFVLETVLNDCDIVYAADLIPQGNCNNAYNCSDAQSLCERIGQPFVNVFDGSNAQPGNYYPFSSSTGPRNPTWFYIPIETSGDLTLEVYQNTQPDFMGQDLDIDFAVYGPFTNPTSQCGNLTIADYVDHSFSVVMPEIAEITNAQAGEFYLILTSNFSSQPGFLKVEIGAASTATVNCDGIRMQSFLDANLNGVVDATDPSFPLGVFQWERNSNGNLMQIATPLGSYNIYDVDPTNSYDLAYNVLPAYTGNYTVSPATYTGVTVPNNSGVVNRDFLVTPTASYEDVVTYIVPQEQPRPGFTYTETVYYTNLGTATVPVGQVIFDYDQTVSIVSVSDPNAVVSPTDVTLAYSNLAPFAIGSFDVEMQIPVIPTVSLGDVLTNVATISPVANDLTPANNTNTSTQIIIGSYDPNDKMESRGEFINPSTFTSEDYFYYTIRFENTGTASAINVRIEDTLDAQLDWNTIEMINSSHNYLMERMEDQVVWRFDNIMLPDSTTDPVGANGHVYFKIKPRIGWAEGTVIPNTAEIYFDFNPPIITNTFTSTFRTPLSNPDVEETVFSLTPNPASNHFTVKFSDAIEEGRLTLYDVRGRVTLSRKLTQNSLQIDISELDQGIYLAKLTTGDRSFTTKLIKK
ncbi:putative secreted protein (Por secretion system target) [Nonlabens dokdonensis]|uniref:Secreted protein (Por secretion system target) n=2 Tax=Nonlabens dokdonensis TaxID=328515 RepID=A0ABX5PW54_9FLAO|nr:T9SS type A sorting domain-containing protein [Nonlabens dokdonensis]AGC75172.1 putative membrane-anchored cell surface protein [Nonlabens dokdonensis DSW-6]PZX39084.1 putative secreted protein (Por secretion system target) [Nonlabens dokdonensis]